MRTFTTLIALAALVLPAAAQQALEEGFDFSSTRIFPPKGWNELNLNSGPSLGWESTTIHPVSLNTLGIDAAGHDDYDIRLTNDFRLCTPEVDLAEYDTPRLVFDESIGYSDYMAHHPDHRGNGVSTIEATVDGVTWVEVWRETRVIDGPYRGIEVFPDMFAATDGVTFAFHYYGTFAHSWAIDNVIVDNGPAPVPELSVEGICPGDNVIHLENMTPAGMAYLAWSFAQGSYPIGSGSCAGVVFPLSKPVPVLAGRVDDRGELMLFWYLPPSACGKVYLAGFDFASCTPTNVALL